MKSLSMLCLLYDKMKKIWLKKGNNFIVLSLASSYLHFPSFLIQSEKIPILSQFQSWKLLAYTQSTFNDAAWFLCALYSKSTSLVQLLTKHIWKATSLSNRWHATYHVKVWKRHNSFLLNCAFNSKNNPLPRYLKWSKEWIVFYGRIDKGQ